jgi:uroporphyrin-III C-methyltransferase
MATKFGLPGKVYLIGAGPGSADLLTVRAATLLRHAEMVLHDDLVSPEVMQLIPASSMVQNVGKRCGKKGITQEQINERLVEFARQGRVVLRLKGGDPLIFGRAQEEIHALREAGIDFEIVPGVTAAFAAAAAAKIPLTERRSASKLLFVSNHQCDQKVLQNWRANVVADTTLVFYMPGHNFAELVNELRDGGLEAETPCLIVSNASRPQQEFVRTTLDRLAAASFPPAPSLLIVGSMVSEFNAGGRRSEIRLEEVLTLDDDRVAGAALRERSQASPDDDQLIEEDPLLSS